MAITTYNTKLSYASAEAGDYKDIDIKSFPSILGKRSSIETTCLSDDAQTFIQGIRQQAESFDFTANWDKTVFSELNALSDVAQYWKLTFQDGSNFTWKGTVSVSNGEGGVDEVQEMTISVTPNTVPVYSAT